MGLTGWSEARAHVENNFPIAKTSGPTVVVDFAVNDGERFAIVCSESRVHGHPWIRISVELAPARDMSLGWGEYLNFEFTVGALAVANDMLHIRHDLPLEGLAPDSLIDAIRSIGQQASFVRSTLKNPTAEANPFAELYT